jgi:hypothetical protein
MSKVNFNVTEESNEPDVQPEAVKAEATEQTKPDSNLPAPYKPVLGDYLPSLADVRLPRINIVHGVGQLKDDFPVGAIVYNSQLILHEAALGKKPATDPVELVVIGWLPIRYVEKIQGGGRGMLCTDLEQVRKAGGTLDYNEWKNKRAAGMRRFEILAEAVCLIKQPELCKAEIAQFPFVIGENRWAIGVWGMKGTAYTNGAKTIFTARKMGCCLDGYPTCSWYASTAVMQFTTEEGKTSIPVPRFVPGKATSAEFRKYAVNIISGSEESDAAEG